MKIWKQNLHDSRINRTKIGLKTVNILICTMIKSVCYKLIKLGTHRVCIESIDATLIIINNNNTSNNKENLFTCGWGNSMNNVFMFFFLHSNILRKCAIKPRAGDTNAIENRELFFFCSAYHWKTRRKKTHATTATTINLFHSIHRVCVCLCVCFFFYKFFECYHWCDTVIMS